MNMQHLQFGSDSVVMELCCLLDRQDLFVQQLERHHLRQLLSLVFVMVFVVAVKQHCLIRLLDWPEAHSKPWLCRRICHWYSNSVATAEVYGKWSNSRHRSAVLFDEWTGHKQIETCLICMLMWRWILTRLCEVSIWSIGLRENELRRVVSTVSLFRQNQRLSAF